MRDVSDDSLLEQLRPRAFAIAYRMLGTVSEAEDIVQESLLRVHQNAGTIENPIAFVTTVTTRLAITALQSARARRESYVGDWLPEPLVSSDDDPASRAELGDDISLALLVTLETLSPEQRAAFLLHDVFGYDYEHVAEIIGKSDDNARQLSARARAHVRERRPRFAVSREQQDELVRKFFAAAEQGDLAGLEQLLASDVTMRGDGGGKVPALGRTVVGRARVAKTLSNGTRAFARIRGLTWRPVEVNGGPGALYLDADGRVIGVIGLTLVDGQVVSVDSVVNPDKLGHLGEVGDAVGLLRSVHPERRA
ncbi:MAG: polymerase sigma-70 factor, subfamily [Schumannella sp.]|nr:polymerase sigma-70 factor, subfamily [Schumannella sp.]